MRNTVSLIMVAVILIGGLLLGGLAKKPTISPQSRVVSAANGTQVIPTPPQSQQSIDDAFNSKATDLRVNLNALFKEHAMLLLDTLTATYSGANTLRLKQLMDDNTSNLASIILMVYGSNAQDTFIKLWTRQIGECENYTLARKSNNLSKMSAAKKNLQTIATDFGDMFDVVSNNIPAETAKNLMLEHISDTLSYVDALHAENSKLTAELLKQNYDQAGRFADAFTKGMILDKPAQF